MNRDELRQSVLESLATVAPEMDPAPLRPDEPLREQLDLDSYDFLQSLIALDRKLSVSIPESDYGQLTTLDACVDYLSRKLAEQGR
jgi:acyl carrier protein